MEEEAAPAHGAGETIEGLALPALGGAEHTTLRVYRAAYKISLLVHSTFLPTCPNPTRYHFLQEAFQNRPPPNLFSDDLHPFSDPPS